MPKNEKKESRIIRKDLEQSGVMRRQSIQESVEKSGVKRRTTEKKKEK